MRERLKSVRYAVADLGYLVGRTLARVPRAFRRAVSGFWGRLTVLERRRLVAALGVVIAALLFLGLAVPNLPCQLPGGDACPPADDAEELVPAEALAYLHANLDPDSDEFATAEDRAAATPVVSEQIASRALALVPGLAGTRAQFDSEVRPWFGGELAIAVLAGRRATEQVFLLEVSHADGAREFASGLAGGRPRIEEHGDTEVSIDARGLATAQIHGFLVIGSGRGVDAVIDAADREGSALADDDAATEVRDELPEHRFAEAWVSRAGVDRLISGSRGQLGTLTPLIEPGATRGVAASLTATGDGYELAIRSLLDPERAAAAPGFFAAFPRFEPRLPARLPGDALAYLGFGDPGTTIGALLSQASAEAPGIASSFEDLLRSLRKRGGVDVQGELLDALGDEGAFALAPRAGEEERAATFPYVEFVADGVDEDRSRRALATLQGPLAHAAPRGVQAPGFDQREIDGVETHSLRLSPTVELTYAVFDGLAAIATAPKGVSRLISDDGGLDAQDLFERATDGFDDDVSMLAYLDLGSLVAIGEGLGLADDPVYATFAGDLRRLDALGLEVTRDDEELSSDARLLLDSSEEGGEPPPVPPPAD